MLDNFDIPPLKQTISEIRNEYEKSVILKAVDDCEKIIGSVRAYREHETVHIGKLIVHPEYQKKGIGTALLREIEAVCRSTRYELFTSDKSQNNLRLYRKLGYRCFKEQEISPTLRFVYLEKIIHISIRERKKNDLHHLSSKRTYGLVFTNHVNF